MIIMKIHLLWLWIYEYIKYLLDRGFSLDTLLYGKGMLYILIIKEYNKLVLYFYNNVLEDGFNQLFRSTLECYNCPGVTSKLSKTSTK